MPTVFILPLLQLPIPTATPSAASAGAGQYALLVNRASLVTGLVCLLMGIYLHYRRRALHDRVLATLLQYLFTGYAIPKAFFLGYCAFYPALLPQMSDYPESLLVAAFCTLFMAFISLKAAYPAKQDSNNERPPEA